MERQKVEEIKGECKRILSYSDGVHDMDHTLRVLSTAMHIGKMEDADMVVVELSSLLHDIGRPLERARKAQNSGDKVCHATEGAKMANDILRRYDIGQERLDNICHCIETHRFRNEKEPQTIEAKILYDSDKLDSIGAIGIGRAFMFSQSVGGRVHNGEKTLEEMNAFSAEDTAYREYLVKLSKIKGKMLTAEGKRIAKGRHAFMEEFFKRISNECVGLS